MSFRQMLLWGANLLALTTFCEFGGFKISCTQKTVQNIDFFFNVFDWDTEDDTANSARRVSARDSDNLACRLKDRVLRILLAHMNISFQSSNWSERETAILSLGAVAHGCERDITQYLPQSIPHLFSILDDEQSLNL